MASRKRIPHLCPKPSQWPVADYACWQKSRQSADIFEAKRAGEGWGPFLVARVSQGYGRWLSWLADEGLLDPLASPGDRVEPKLVVKYVAALRAVNAPRTVQSRIQELYLALEAMVPARDWRWLRNIEAQLKRAIEPSSDRRSRLVSSDQLYDLGRRLMAEAEAMRHEELSRRASHCRDGLMISLLAARPFRRRNFAAIEIDRHLVRQDGAYWIRFEGRETKNRRPLEYPFPSDLVSSLERYLSFYRPTLATGEGYWRGMRGAPARSALWLSEHGTALSQVAMSARFKKLTEDYFGHLISMHRFRDCAATSIATDDPEHVRITMAVLGHTSLRTSEATTIMRAPSRP
jgi:integrase/recombinase XerD